MFGSGEAAARTLTPVRWQVAVALDVSDSSVRPRHWPITERLVVEFPDVAPVDVLSAVLDAWRRVELFGLSHQAEVVMAAKIATETLVAQRGTAGRAGLDQARR
jgi:hypothetical protein